MKSQARIFAVLLAAAATQSAFASDGTINFSGKLMDSTCVVTANGKVGAPVTLPTLSATVLNTATNVAGQTGFNIQLSACTGTTTTAAAFFETGPGVDPVTNNVINTGTAQFVQLQLVDPKTGKAIKAGDVSQSTSTSRVTKNTAGDTILPYAVQYVATGKATGGTVVGSVTYSIDYQ